MKLIFLVLFAIHCHLSSSTNIVPIDTSAVDIKQSGKNYAYSIQERHGIAAIDHPSLQIISQQSPLTKVNQPHQSVLISNLVNKVQLQQTPQQAQEPIFSLDEGQQMQNQNPQIEQRQPIMQMQQQQQKLMQSNNILQPKQEIAYTSVPISYNYVPLSYQYALSYPYEIYYPYNIIGTI